MGVPAGLFGRVHHDSNGSSNHFTYSGLPPERSRIELPLREIFPPPDYSTVTLLAKFLGLSTSQPRVTAV